MSGFNRIIMTGNLTRDPEYKQLSSGQALCRLGLATNRQYKNRQSGSMVQEVCYVDIDVWGAQAESCRQYLQKGRPVLIEGRLKFDSWKDQEGQTRSKHTIVADRVVFLGSAAGSNSGEGSYESDSSNGSDNGSDRLDPQNAFEKDILDQLDSIKNKKQASVVSAAKKVTPSSEAAPVSKAAMKNSTDDNHLSMGEVNLSDEQPFDDELPF